MNNARKYTLKIEKQPPSKLTFLQLPKPQKDGIFPKVVDLRNKMPAIYDQGNLGSCTANALCCLIGYNNPAIKGSRLFVYYNERVLENDVKHDSGATLDNGINCLKKYGVCQETDWPYDIAKFAICPPKKCYTNALQHIAINATNVNNDIISIKNSLFHGYPLVVGIMVYNSFESSIVAKTGNVPMPLPKDSFLGGHAVVCVGYDDNKKVWIMRNSWGPLWGLKGYFYLPYEYLTSNLASDLWNITKVK